MENTENKTTENGKSPIHGVMWRLLAYKNINDYYNKRHYYEGIFKKDIECEFISNRLNKKNGGICYWEKCNAT